MSSRTFRRMAILAGIVALLVPLAASGGDLGKAGGATGRGDSAKRMLFATDSGGSLLSFRAAAPEAARSRPITGLPGGVVLKDIDFRPATGDLYALGSDKVVYRVNPRTAIAVAEGPAFETAATALTGDRIGFDFNPTVDKIRVTSDADDNLRLDPDPGSLLATDTKLTPAEVSVVGSAYTNSSFAAFANRPATTMLFAIDVASGPDALSPVHREMLELQYDSDLTQSQVAVRLGIPLGTVKSRTLHGLRALSRELRERGLHD